MQAAGIAPHRFDAKEYGDKKDNESQELAGPVAFADDGAKIATRHRAAESNDTGQDQPKVRDLVAIWLEDAFGSKQSVNAKKKRHPEKEQNRIAHDDSKNGS
jgi:hypothetical protein